MSDKTMQEIHDREKFHVKWWSRSEIEALKIYNPNPKTIKIIRRKVDRETKHD